MLLQKWDVTGVPEALKESQSYTDAFGRQIVFSENSMRVD